jgi:hypothetical protein
VGISGRFSTFRGLVVAEDGKVKNMSEHQNDAVS